VHSLARIRVPGAARHEPVGGTDAREVNV